VKKLRQSIADIKKITKTPEDKQKEAEKRANDKKRREAKMAQNEREQDEMLEKEYARGQQVGLFAMYGQKRSRSTAESVE